MNRINQRTIKQYNQLGPKSVLYKDEAYTRRSYSIIGCDETNTVTFVYFGILNDTVNVKVRYDREHDLYDITVTFNETVIFDYQKMFFDQFMDIQNFITYNSKQNNGGQ